MFQEYQKRTEDGYENMGWKDSGELDDLAGRHAGARSQGGVRIARLRLRRMAAHGRSVRRPGPARAAPPRLREKAAALFKKFNDVFWNEELGFYAYLLDGEKRPVPTIASNAGHLLWSGIVPPDRAARVVARLMAPDMNTGWGIRTLSSKHGAYNPYSYQNGSVWPHDNSLIALGFKRYGFAAEVAAIARGISDAASHFESNQLPELYAGIDRATSPFPVQYLGANVPQAWAAGSAFALLQAILGHRTGRTERPAVDRSRSAGVAAGHHADRHSPGSGTFLVAIHPRRRHTDCEVLDGDPAVVRAPASS